MPEIPDVEISKRYIDATSLHRRVARAMVRDTRLLECSPSTLRRHLQGHRLTETRRHGKYLFAHLEHGPWLLLHFGMTGGPLPGTLLGRGREDHGLRPGGVLLPAVPDP
jgi:formamidopyrimidine-DNA glycosylase